MPTAPPIVDCRRVAEQAPCLMQPTVDVHGRALDAAHGKLREHEGMISNLGAQTIHYLERLVRVEAATSEQHAMMVQMQGSIEGLRLEQSGILRAINTVAETGQSTHDLLVRHIDLNTMQTEVEHHARLAQVERISVRLIKVATAVTLLAAMLGMLYSLLSGKPMLSILLGAAP